MFTALPGHAVRRVQAHIKQHAQTSNMTSRNLLPVGPAAKRRTLWNPNHGITFASASQPLILTSNSGLHEGSVTHYSPGLEVSIHKDVARRFHKVSSGVNRTQLKTPESIVPLGSSSMSTSVGVRCTQPMVTEPVSVQHEPPTKQIPRAPNAAPTKSVMRTRSSLYQKAPSLKWEMAFSKPLSHPDNGMEWTIPDDIFNKTLNQEPGTEASYYSHKLYRGPGRLGPNSNVTVHYCRSYETTEKVCQQYFADEPVLGFDLEWLANASSWQGPRENVSLVQLASPARVALFHVALFKKDPRNFFPPMLKRILQDPEIIKCGVWITNDFTRLRNFLNLDPRGALELSQFHNLVTFCKLGHKGRKVPKKARRMMEQVEQVLGLPMYKGNDVRTSTWDQPLSLDQVHYSAADAYAGLQLYHVYEQERKRLHPTPSRPPHAELSLEIRVKGDDGIDEDEEMAFVEAHEAKKLESESFEESTFKSNTTKTLSDSLVSEGFDDAFVTKTTLDTTPITDTVLTNSSPQIHQTLRPTTAVFPSVTESSFMGPVPPKEKIPRQRGSTVKQASVTSTLYPTTIDVALVSAENLDTKVKRENQALKKRSKRPFSIKDLKSLPPAVAEATVWADNFLAQFGDVEQCCTRSQLRAYRLWTSDPSRSVADVAAMLRDPPLQSRTIAQYIIDVLKVHGSLRPDGGHGLEVEPERFYNEILVLFGQRYSPKWMVEAIKKSYTDMPLFPASYESKTPENSRIIESTKNKVIKKSTLEAGHTTQIVAEPSLYSDLSSLKGASPVPTEESMIAVGMCLTPTDSEILQDGQKHSNSVRNELAELSPLVTECSMSPTTSELEALRQVADELKDKP